MKPNKPIQLSLGQFSDGDQIGYTLCDGSGGLSVMIVDDGDLFLEPIVEFAKQCNVTVPPWLLPHLDEGIPQGLVDLVKVRWRRQHIETFLKKLREVKKGYYKVDHVSVDPHELYQQIKSFIRRFYCADEEVHYTVLALFSLMSHVFLLFESVPYLHLIGEPSSGKTVCGTVIENLAFNGRQGASITSAALYRYIECTRGLLIIDEQMQGNRQWTNVLLAGYRRNGGAILCDKRTMLPIGQDSYGPKLLLTNDPIRNAALETRFLRIYARKATSVRERFSHNKLQEELAHLRDEQHLFGITMSNAICDAYWSLPEIPELMHRDADLAAPLLAIAKVIDNSSYGADSIYDEVVGYLKNEAARKKQEYWLDADAPALARAIVDFTAYDHERDKDSEKHDKYHVAEEFTYYINKHRFLDRSLATREIGRKLNLSKLVTDRRVVDCEVTAPGSIQSQSNNGKRTQRRAYRFDLLKAWELRGVMS